jgi:hypothetical protein
MKFKNGYLFHRTNMKNGYLLASLHWRWSITWRWALWLQFTKKLRPFFRYFLNLFGAIFNYSAFALYVVYVSNSAKLKTQP